MTFSMPDFCIRVMFLNEKKSQHNARKTAWTILRRVMGKGLTLNEAFNELGQQVSEQRNISQVKSLCFGTLRWLPRLQAISRQLLDKPLRKKDSDIELAILLGLFQLEYQHGPAHAAISESVNLVKQTRKSWAKGLVNAVLRRFQRERETITTQVDTDISVRQAHPSWLVDALRQAWPQYWQSILENNNQHPPMTLRLRTSPQQHQQLRKELDEAGIHAKTIDSLPAALILDHAVNVDEIPGFTEGLVTVQDGAAQLAAELLDPQAGERILDACAAPGGKTAHLLDRQPELDSLVAIDNVASRLSRMEKTLRRMHLDARMLLADAGQTEQWWDGQPFQKILLDAPCSATGIIRRHPDIKLHRTPEAIQDLVNIQYNLLNSLWKTLAPGGRLLYATCSVLPDENHEQISRFLAAHGDATIIPITRPFGHSDQYGFQILPGENNMDGFFYAMLEKARI